VWPARHSVRVTTDTKFPPMGIRVRLKASFDVTAFPPEAQIVLRAMQKYGMILADIGSPWYFSGAPNDEWNNDLMHDQMLKVHGSDFEVVDADSMRVSLNTAQAKQQ
jgi:hypothetical protein